MLSRGYTCCPVDREFLQEWDAAEICCGSGRLSRILRYAGFTVASLDIQLWTSQVPPPPPTAHNPLDLLEPGGFSLLSFRRIPAITCNLASRLICQQPQAPASDDDEAEAAVMRALRFALLNMERCVKRQYIAVLFDTAWQSRVPVRYRWEHGREPAC